MNTIAKCPNVAAYVKELDLLNFSSLDWVYSSNLESAGLLSLAKRAGNVIQSDWYMGREV